MSKSDDSVDERYYRHAGSISMVRQISAQARRLQHKLFMRVMRPMPEDRILDIGTSDDTGPESNMLEQLYPWPERIVCAGLSDGRAVTAAYPGVNHVTIQAGDPLPFGDNAFSIVYSNAVLEHVGNKERQRQFLAEMCRLAPARFLAIPNRYFPVEHHTCLPLIHYLPKPWFRRLLNGTRYDVWAHEENLNYLSPSDLEKLWPPPQRPRIAYTGVGIGFMKSNLVAYETDRTSMI